MTRIASTCSNNASASLLVLTTGSWASTSRSRTGSNVRMPQTNSWFSESSAMPVVVSRMDESGAEAHRNGIRVRSRGGMA